MPMLPGGGNNPPLSIQEINAAYAGRGNNLNAYRGTMFYRPDNSTGFLPAGEIKLSDFYSTSGVSPVVPGSFAVSGGGAVTLPSMFNYLYVTCYGAGGGGGQGSRGTGFSATNPGSPGSGGGSTFFMPGTGFQVSAGGGGGGGGAGQTTTLNGGLYADGSGSPGAVGAGGGGGGGGGGGALAGGAYSNNQPPPSYFVTSGANGGNGGQGGNSGEVLVMNRDTMGFNAIRSYYGVTVGISIGAGGAGGGAAFNAGSVGSPGSGGWIVIRWT